MGRRSTRRGGGGRRATDCAGGGRRSGLTTWVVVLAGGAVAWLLASGAATAESQFAGDVFDFGITAPDEPLTVGDTIVFTNSGERPHTVTDRGNTFDTNAIAPGDTAAVTFDVPGTYEIFCRINPVAMNATVVVEPGEDPPDEVRVQTFDPSFHPDPDETLRFDPPELEVRPGTRVTVANVGGQPHTLTADDGSFDTGEIEPGAEEGRFAGDHASFVAEEEGVYGFRCRIHPEEMQGTLIVADDPAEPDPPPPDDPPDEPPDDEPPDDEREVIDPGAGATDAVAVAIEDFSFVPFEVAALPGAQLTWTNRGAVAHTATFDEVEGRVEGLDTGTVAAGETGTLSAPEAPGSYSYLCEIHPSMRGVLVVAAQRDPPTDDAAAGDPVDAAPADDEAGAAAPASDGDFATPALVGAIAIVLAGAGAFVIALRGGRPDESGGDGSG